MNVRPDRKPGVRLCLALTPEGLTAYGNKKAFAALREQLLWLEGSDEKDNFECHVTMALEDDACVFEGKRPRNVFPLISREFGDIVPLHSESCPGFELTFMLVADDLLDDNEKYQENGVLPDDWNADA